MPQNSNSVPSSDENLSAVEKFTLEHDFKQIPSSVLSYQELIPKTAPGPGQQYAFEVDLDRCTGCKACVTACHNENGLEIDETWRSVGLVVGGTSEQPLMQHVTTACHHCAEPACMEGCPTKAYEKDPATGIVKHLEDQCFGCQYCILKCPYDVPKYSKKKGIVHKCDMCIGRLKEGESPACVKACPTSAIRISIVDKDDLKKKYQEYVNVPAAPASNYTYPSTKYKTTRQWPANMTSVDYLTVKPEHAHMPLVWMLVLTQLSVGTFCVQLLLNRVFQSSLSAVHVFVALGVGLLALAASIFHLGRPQYFYRAVLGFKTSWLSREIIAFGIFAQIAILYSLCVQWSLIRKWIGMVLGGAHVLDVLGMIVCLTGLIGVLCSVMVYRDTKRPFWDNHFTTFKFLSTMVLLGCAMSLVMLFAIDPQMNKMNQILKRNIAAAIAGISVVKLLVEAGIFTYLVKDDQHFLKKSAVLMVRPLRKFTLTRFMGGALGGIIIPIVFLFFNNEMSWWLGLMGGLGIFVFVFAGECLERYLFFRAVVSLKMPGGQIN